MKESKIEVYKDFKRQSGFDPITFTFSENSNYGQESLLEVDRQNIGGHCFALLPRVNFPANNLNFH